MSGVCVGYNFATYKISPSVTSRLACYVLTMLEGATLS